MWGWLFNELVPLLGGFERETKRTTAAILGLFQKRHPPRTPQLPGPVNPPATGHMPGVTRAVQWLAKVADAAAQASQEAQRKAAAVDGARVFEGTLLLAWFLREAKDVRGGGYFEKNLPSEGNIKRRPWRFEVGRIRNGRRVI